jgi:uncharacterized SAM-dependent methyltransferase
MRDGATIPVLYHPTALPQAVRRDLAESLRSRDLRQKFLYEGERQTRLWLALHEAFSPARNDADCIATYEKAFAAATRELSGAPGVHVAGLGCGGGRKELQLLKTLARAGWKAENTLCDASAAMTLSARDAVLAGLPETACHLLVCDLGRCTNLGEVLDQQTPAGHRRVLTFFGMIQNFDPLDILRLLQSALRPGDLLLVSANLAPGADYEEGTRRIFPLYDNALTRNWVLQPLLDLGITESHGELRFSLERDLGGLLRIEARFHFKSAFETKVQGETLRFAAGESIRLFYSYRHTPDSVRQLLRKAGFGLLGEWISASDEEGVFLASLTDCPLSI